MAANVAALDELAMHLQSLQALKPPGVTPTKVKVITKLCVDNIQSGTAIVQKILQQFQNSAATHKLGVLYIVDSVARQWVEKAKQAGQSLSINVAPGTYASGVQLVREVLPVLMNNLLHSVPENQKEKISKLLDIWERGHTFPLDMLANFKQQLSGDRNGFPQPNGNSAGQAFAAPANPTPAAPVAQKQAQAPSDTSALFAAFAGLGQQNIQANVPSVTAPAFPFMPNLAPPPPALGFVPPPPAPANVQPAMPAPLPAGMSNLANQILQAMSVGSIAPDQAIQVLNALASAQNGGISLTAPQPAATQPALPHAQVQAQTVPTTNMQLDRYEQHDARMRERSRSPNRQRARSPLRRSPPLVNRRESPTYGVYDPDAGPEGNTPRYDRSRNRGGQRGGRNDYRQRTPPRRQPSPHGNTYGQSKYIEWDETLPRDHIRVLSRTLFIGGAGGTEGEIRSLFTRFGRVQTCIVNQEKRHAFVKMLTRPEAVAAKDGMDALQDPVTLSKARQTRWGVGFGPRDCSDYATGISVIPLSRLTDADRKWALNAEHGGTGGRPLEGGMIIEEPDIEIGAGVSSKAISRRVPTDGGRGGRGGFGARGDFGAPGARGGFDNAPAKSRKQERPVNDPRHISPRAEQGVAVPPAVPGFGFKLPGL